MAALDTAPILTAARLQTTPTHPLVTAVDEYLRLMSNHVGVRGRGKPLASFLPGVSSGITRLLTSDAKTVESVLCLGLVTWAHYVALGVAEEVESVSKVEFAQRESLVVERTGAWLQETAKHLNVLIQRICVLVTSEVWKVRVQLVGWAHCLLQHCSM